LPLIIALQRRLALLGRALLFGSRWQAPWVAGTGALGLAKLLENMEIGHLSILRSLDRL
jgi:NADPH-dependent stearoyl-CoA 9-desaturase